MLKKVKVRMLKEDHDKINDTETRKIEVKEELRHVPVRVMYIIAKGVEFDGFLRLPNRLSVPELKQILEEEQFIREGISYRVRVQRKDLNMNSEDEEEIRLKEFSKILVVEEVKLSFLDSELK